MYNDPFHPLAASVVRKQPTPLSRFVNLLDESVHDTQAEAMTDASNKLKVLLATDRSVYPAETLRAMYQESL